MVINLINVYWFSSLFIYHNTYILSFCIFCQLNVQWKRGLFFYYFTIMIFFHCYKGFGLFDSLYLSQFEYRCFASDLVKIGFVVSEMMKFIPKFRNQERRTTKDNPNDYIILLIREIGTSLNFKLCFM